MRVADRSPAEPAAAAAAGAPLPRRPPISAPAALRGPADLAAERRRTAGQPRLGLLGLLLVVPIAVPLAVGAGGAEGSVLVLAPLITFALPLVAVVAFWWEDWPGTRLRASWSGWADTALIIVGAVVLTAAGQAVAGGVDLHGIFDPTPGRGHVPTFPATLPLGGAAFVAMLQLTLVGEGWPMRSLPAVPAGLAALAVAWIVALVVYFTLVEIHPPAGSGLTPRDGPVAGADLGAALVVIGAWQVLFYVLWRGWPFSAIGSRAVRLSGAHATVLVLGVLTFVLAHDVAAINTPWLGAAAGSFIAAGLLLGMLLEGFLSPRLMPATERAVLAAGVGALAAALGLGLAALASDVAFERAGAADWVGHVTLNALGVSIILHVAIGRRGPLGAAAHGRQDQGTDQGATRARTAGRSATVDAHHDGRPHRRS
jgi:hypothetical protein